MVKKVVPQRFGCLRCGTPFEANPPDDQHDMATRNERYFEHHIKVDYKCENCANINTLYWGHPAPAFVVG